MARKEAVEEVDSVISTCVGEYIGDFDPDDGTISQLIDQLLLPAETFQS